MHDPIPQTRPGWLLALWLTWGGVTLVACAITAGIFFNERAGRLAEAEQHLQVELAYLQHLLTTTLQGGEYEQAREQIAAWGRLNLDTLRLTLTAGNGYILGEFERAHPPQRTVSHREQISFSYRGRATLELEKTLEPTHQAIAQLGWQLAGALGSLTVLGLLLVIQNARYQHQVRLTRAEYGRRLQTQQALERMATLDALTGLPNRYMLDEQLSLRVAEAARFRRKLALLFIDLDNFKNINDSFGHEAGDRLLKTVAERMATGLRGYDLLARFGGDEFVVLLSNVTTPDEVERVAQKVTEALEPRIELEGRELFVSGSIGISIYPDDGDSAGDLLRKSDAAMYTAKAAGRNCYRFYTDAMNEAVAHRHQIEQGLHRALANGELHLVYRPQVEIASGRIRSCEALLRWRSGERQIPPAEFIPIAEQSVLMRELQQFVITEATRQRAEWRRLGVDGVRVDINLSGARPVVSDMFERLDEALRQQELTPGDIGIELTEHVLIEASDEMIDNLARLRERGSTVSLDDFGTGYSSLGYLKSLPVDILKIDRAFIKDLPDGPMDCAIVKAVIAMGHSMGKKILAEGVETQAQLDYIRDHGCDLAQGYLLHRPMPAAEVTPLLAGDHVNGTAPGG